MEICAEERGEYAGVERWEFVAQAAYSPGKRKGKAVGCEAAALGPWLDWIHDA